MEIFDSFENSVERYFLAIGMPTLGSSIFSASIYPKDSYTAGNTIDGECERVNDKPLLENK